MLSFFFSTLLFFGACVSKSENSTAKDDLLPVSARLEKQYDEVIALHDEVMPKRSDMIRLERELNSSSLDTSLVAFAKTRLERADDAMMAWMQSEKSLTNLAENMNENQLEAHILTRKQLIQEVADSMLASILYAEQLLAQ